MLRQRDVFHRHWAILGSRSDGKEHPGQEKSYGFTFAIKPPEPALGTFSAATGTTPLIVGDGVVASGGSSAVTPPIPARSSGLVGCGDHPCLRRSVLDVSYAAMGVKL